MRKIVTISMLSALVLVSFSIAQDVLGSSHRVEQRQRRGSLQDVRKERMEERRETRGLLKEKRSKMMEGNQPRQIKEKHRELKLNFDEIQRDLREDIKARRIQMKEKIESSLKEYREKIAIIRDERKRAILERLANRFDMINEKITDHFARVLERLENILLKIESRTDKAEARGRDISAIRPLIDTASYLIDLAREAARVQASKTYPITIVDEETLGQQVSRVRRQLGDDLGKVRETLKAARDALKEASRVLASITDVDTEPEDIDKTATSTQ